MEAGAPKSPTADESIHAAAAGRRTEGVNPLAPGSQCLDGGPLYGVCPPSFFLLSLDHGNRSESGDPPADTG